MDKKKYFLLNRKVNSITTFKIVFGFFFVIRVLVSLGFMFWGIERVSMFNAISAAFYLLGFWVIPKTKHTNIWIFLFWLDVMINVLSCNRAIGWGYGFTSYGIVIIPLIFYLLYVDEHIKNEIPIAIGLSFLDIIVLVLSSFFNKAGNKSDYISMHTTTIIFCINLILCCITLTFCFAVFIIEMEITTELLRIKNEALDFLANYDELTKLRNRHTMAKIFHEYEESKEAFCVVLGDIDDFKKVNDTYGHSCGDQVLIEISEILRYAVGNDGIVCRWGGEEILILLKMQKEQGLLKIESIRETVEGFCIKYDDNKVNVTMTYGFTYDKEAVNVEKLVALADDRLYYGKKHGKNQVVSINH